MKTGKEWFNLLSEDEQKRFKENSEIQNIGYNFFEKMNNTYYSFFSFIASGFDWGSSNEGLKYWSKISDRHKDKNSLLL